MTSHGEERCKAIFENIFNEKFPNVRPSWLMNHQTGILLEFDGYCQRLKLAFEYDGIQHFEYPNIFHQTHRQFESQRRIDEMKNRKCKIYGVTLIRIKYNIENLEGYIKQRLKEKNFIK